MLIQTKLFENTKEALKKKRDLQLQNKRDEFTSQIKNANKIEEESKKTTEPKEFDPSKSQTTITIIYGDHDDDNPRASLTPVQGFSIKDLDEAKVKFEAKGCQCEIINLNDALNGAGTTGDKAAVLVVR